jgi:hypothetical protein
MKIIGFNQTKILAERKEKIEGNVSINQKININKISSEAILLGDKDAIKIEFTFSTIFSEDTGKIEFSGFVMILPEGEEEEKFKKSMGSNKIPEDLRLPIFNFIMGKCTLKTLGLEEELGLPLHIQMPKLNPKKKEE